MIESNLPKILLVELDYHSDLYSFLIELTDNSRYDIHCLTNDKIYAQLTEKLKQKCTFFISNRNKEIKKYLDQNTFDFVFINTIEDKLSFWADNCPKNTMIRVHDVNTYFLPLKSLYIEFLPVKIFKAISYLINRQLLKFDYYYLNKLIKKVDYFSFLSEQNKEYFISKRPDIKDKAGETFPLAAYNEEFFKLEKTDKLTFVVPGTLESKRKDFKIIYETCKILSELDINCEVVFAGLTPKQSNGFVNRIKSFENKKLKITNFNYFLSHNEFDSIVKGADFLIFPMTKVTTFKIFKEIYGKTKISGSIKDLIKFGKISIMPSWYDLSEDLVELTYRYENIKDLKEKITKAVFDLKEEKNNYYKLIENHKKRYNFQILSDFQNQLFSIYTKKHEKNQ